MAINKTRYAKSEILYSVKSTIQVLQRYNVKYILWMYIIYFMLLVTSVICLFNKNDIGSVVTDLLKTLVQKVLSILVF